MYFCPKCSFTLDISKSNIKVDQENKIIDNVDEIYFAISSCGISE